MRPIPFPITSHLRFCSQGLSFNPSTRAREREKIQRPTYYRSCKAILGFTVLVLGFCFLYFSTGGYGYATSTFPTMHLICPHHPHPHPPLKFCITFVFYFSWLPPPPPPPRKFCITFVFYFSWLLQPYQEKLKTMLQQNFAGQIRCIMGSPRES